MATYIFGRRGLWMRTFSPKTELNILSRAQSSCPNGKNRPQSFEGLPSSIVVLRYYYCDLSTTTLL